MAKYQYFRNRATGKVEACYTNCTTNSPHFKDAAKYEEFNADKLPAQAKIDLNEIKLANLAKQKAKLDAKKAAFAALPDAEKIRELAKKQGLM